MKAVVVVVVDPVCGAINPDRLPIECTQSIVKVPFGAKELCAFYPLRWCAG